MMFIQTRAKSHKEAFLRACLWLKATHTHFLLLETGSSCVISVIFNSLCYPSWPQTQDSSCLSLLSAGITDVHQWTWHECVCVCVCVCIHMCTHTHIFDSTGQFELDLTFDGRILYHLSHTSAPFCFSHFWGRVSHFCLGPSLSHNPISSHVAGLTGASHYTQFVVIFQCYMWALCYYFILEQNKTFVFHPFY
jgi:hypothetical protein